MAALHQIEDVFQIVVQYGVLLLECVGVSVLLVTAVKSIIGCIKRTPHIRLYLAQGISLALEFKLGGEVLRTVIVRELSELLVLGLVILLRGALTLIIHWEIKVEEARIGEAAQEAGEREEAASIK
ncbi:DUF1622 domain-containing protein [Oscillospiraceae bacterium 38-13]|jgi:uncharacterized membrane protein|uniref:DUF1622 domain-containing protein n=1 Tax=uncultured Oscillibacter sp. TaxID=876091 RepID=UPI002602E220|nr:DUF1622 domain-containing protein [uncultured Oscillibacter sp.]